MHPPRPPKPSAVDAEFARFASTGDPTALTRVFDTLAPRLILIAVHLVDDEADAEDLLQATFVEAIRSADRFTRGRPVMPWLVAILARRAANLRRARGRRRVTGSAGAEAAVDPTTDPGAEVAAKETAERIAAAIDALPPPIREVLNLHLLHGMRPVEVARALDRPVGTVHAQLHRGLAKLRRALPRSIAPLAVLLGTRGTAAVRAAVLAEGRRFAVATGTGIAVGKWFAAAGLSVVLISGAWLVPWTGRSATAEDRDGNRLGLAADRAPGKVTAEEPTAAAPPTRSQLASGPHVVVTGRAIAQETGAPLIGATVRIAGYHSKGRDLPESWQVPEPVRTGTDGRYRIAVPLVADVGIGFRLTAPSRVTVNGSWYDLRPGVVLDHGDVPMPLGCRLLMRVLDEDARPVEDFGLQLQAGRQPDRYRHDLSLEGHGIERTDREGALPPVVVVPGRVTISEYTDAAYEYVGPWSFEVQPGVREYEAVFRVRNVAPSQAIRGVVTDQSGAPVAKVEIGATVGRGWRTTRTRRDGSFAVGTFDPKRAPLTIGLMYSDRELEMIEPRKPVAVGTKDLRVVVRRLLPVPTEFTVTDRTGRAIEEFAAVCFPGRFDPQQDGTRLDQDDEPLEMGRHPEGRFTRHLRPGHYLLCLRPADDRLALVFGQAFDVPDGSGGVRIPVVLHDYRSFTVRAVTADGQPVPDVQVRLHRSLGPGRVRHGGWTRQPDQLLAGRPGGTYAMLATPSVHTGADGIATLRAGPELGSAELSLEAPHIAPTRLAVGPDTPSAEVRVVVESAAVIEGQLRPAGVALDWGPSPERRARWAAMTNREQEVLARMPRVRLVQTTDPDLRSGPVPVGVDGRFELESVPAGDWQVEFVHRVGSSYRYTPIGVLHQVTGGERRKVTFDVQHLRPATLSGTVWHNGTPVRHGTLRLKLHRGGAYAKIAGNGRFEVRSLPAEELTPTLEIGVSPRTDTLIGAAPLRLYAGEHREVRLEFTSRQVTVRLHDATGAPVAGQRISLWLPGQATFGFRQLTLRRVTDRQGLASFVRLPTSTVEVRLWPDDVPANYQAMPDPERAPVLGTIPPGARPVVGFEVPQRESR